MEVIIASILIWGGGFYIINQARQQEQVKVDTWSDGPLSWSPQEHSKLMDKCSLLCNETVVIEYDMRTGECKCSGNITK